jgi:hypothetical protein
MQADFQDQTEELAAIGALTALSLPLAIFGAGEVIDAVDDGIEDDLDAARSHLDVALGYIEQAELELLQMRRAMSPDGTASTAALEEVQELRRVLAHESDPAFYDNDDGEAEKHAFRVVNSTAKRTAQLIVGLQQIVETETSQIRAIELRAGDRGSQIHEDEQTAREEAENARVAAEAALTACGVAFDWGLDDPLDATFDQEESNQGGYVPLEEGPPPPLP